MNGLIDRLHHAIPTSNFTHFLIDRIDYTMLCHCYWPSSFYLHFLKTFIRLIETWEEMEPNVLSNTITQIQYAGADTFTLNVPIFY